MQMITAGARKVDLIRAFGKLTPQQITDRRYPSVSKLKRKFGLEKVENTMAVIFSDLSSSFDGELGPDDVEELAAEISSSHLTSLSLEDVYYVCRQVKSTKNNWKLNVNKVMKALEDHFEVKTTLAAQRTLNKHLANQFHEDRASTEEVYNQFKQRQRQALTKYNDEKPK